MQYEIRINGGQGTFSSFVIDCVDDHAADSLAETIAHGIRLCGGSHGHVEAWTMDHRCIHAEQFAASTPATLDSKLGTE